jgi:hypothetical protein
VNNVLADRAKQEAGESTSAPRPDYQEVGTFASFDQSSGRQIVDKDVGSAPALVDS